MTLYDKNNIDIRILKMNSRINTKNLRKYMLMTPQEWFVYKVECLQINPAYVQWLEKNFV